MNWTRGRAVGRGSSATVSAATCLKSGEIFAVKSNDLSRSELLQREAQILSSLSSPYIIGYRGSEITKEPTGEALYNLLMEHAPYGTLTLAARKNGGKMEECVIVRYTRHILRGLEYLHSNGIAHCDIKGSNVLIGQNGQAKIADFGCAKRVGPKRRVEKEERVKEENRLSPRSELENRLNPDTEPKKGLNPGTETENRLNPGTELEHRLNLGTRPENRLSPGTEPLEPARGTPAFMAPEVARGEYQSLESDIWAVGCTVIEMATGSPPFVKTGTSEQVSVLYRIGYLGLFPAVPAFLSQQAKDFLEKCLRRDPRERWTASQLLSHPFLAKLDYSKSENQTQQSVSKSPTSVIDQEFWNSVDEEEKELEYLDHPYSCGTARERIGRLCSFPSGGPIRYMNGQDWIMVREGSNEIIMDEIEVKDR